MRRRRKALPADTKSRAASAVCRRIAASKDVRRLLDPSAGGGALAVYLASPDEIDLSEAILTMLGRGVTVVAPRWNGETYELAKLKGLDGDSLRTGPMGILEPADADIVLPQRVAVWLVPGLAFTRDGGRLGYGGGWYDRLMASADERSLKLGIACSFQIVDSLPSEPHDIKLDEVIAPDGVVKD